ncbi:zinc metallopeptidase [Leucothrix pacifica]|uniref:Zn-dependent protease n=1 Tax=Leucothrix pacifica TaxID=1247513 RepID=A0A317C4P9_9GAMM|nr:zinc metallopeptidase [Leucothrix pacifica]PWQ93277.1 Zn-dependent protease [Leucothrix pacifica]
MIYIALIAILALLSYLPQLWIRRVMKQNSYEIPEMEGTGGELAKHLIERFGLTGIGVEKTDENADHFDPTDQMVRLSPSNYDGKSLKAVAVAAHEVGHAIQFHRKEEIFKLREKYIPQAIKMRKLGVYVLWASPIFALVLRTPVAIAMPILISIVMQIISAMTYLVVLPEEWDASFGKALPILREGYVPEEYMPQAESVLRAAAFTYFAAALSSMLNLGYLMLLLRR